MNERYGTRQIISVTLEEGETFTSYW